MDLEFDSEDLLNVNYSLIRSWIVTLVDAQISNTSVNRKIASLKSYYKFLLKTKQIEVSPLLKHKSLKTPKTLQIPFSEKVNYRNDFTKYFNKCLHAECIYKYILCCPHFIYLMHLFVG